MAPHRIDVPARVVLTLLGVALLLVGRAIQLYGSGPWGLFVQVLGALGVIVVWAYDFSEDHRHSATRK
jgi:threonine dehydrogenase-like Zn-dependent dehydrogenase